MGIPSEKRDLGWVKEVCRHSKLIHINVWRFYVERWYVEHKVLPLLNKIIGEIAALGKRKSGKSGLDVYGSNVAKRVKNLKENYLEGKRSAFVPGDKIREMKSAIV